MTPANIDMVLSVITLISKSIKARMDQQNELLNLFERAREEGRDFTDEEVNLWKMKATDAIRELEALIPTLLNQTKEPRYAKQRGTTFATVEVG